MRLYQPEALTLVKRSDFMVEFKEAYEIATNFFLENDYAGVDEPYIFNPTGMDM